MADFKAASSAIASLKVGTDSVAKVYAGADLVWSPPSSASADWDTYEVGAGMTQGYGNVQRTTNFDTAYPLHSGVYDPRLNFGGYTSKATARYANYTNRLAMPAYYAIWISQAEADAGTFGEADNSGWYVFQKDADPNPGGNGSQLYTPIACPTGGGDIGSGLGLFNNSGEYNVVRLLLSNYVDSTGEGGTDHWRDPDEIFVYNPTAIDGCVAWFDASDASTITGTTNISNWADKSGNTASSPYATSDLAQATSADQPSLNTGGLNGKNTIYFDGTESLIGTMPHNLLNASLFIVGKPDNDDEWVYMDAGPATYTPSSDNGSGTTVLWSNFESSGSGTDLKNYVNGVEQSWTDRDDIYQSMTAAHIYEGVDCRFTSWANSSGTTQYHLGGFGRHYTTFGFNGDIAEILIFEKALTESQRKSIEGYLAHKWGLEASLPLSHPYKSLAPTKSSNDWDVSEYENVYATDYSLGGGQSSITYTEDYNNIITPFVNSGTSLYATKIKNTGAGQLGVEIAGGNMSSLNFGKAYPYAALYSASQGWRVMEAVGGGTYKADFRYHGGSSSSGNTFNEMSTDLALLLFSDNPGSVESWRAYDGPSRYSTRQTITYTLTNSSWTNMGVSSSGDAILKDVTFSWPPGYWDGASSNTKPRFVLGSYTSGYTSAQVGALWNSLRIGFSFNGGERQILGQPVDISSNQTSYINSGDGLGNTSALAVGQTIAYFVSDLEPDWDGLANGVYGVDELNTSASTLKAIPGYAATTYSNTMTSMLLGSVTGGYVPKSGNTISGYDGIEAPYIAVYINEYSDATENLSTSNAKGWYVFKNDIPSTGATSQTEWETPIAWPSDTSTSQVATENASGYLGSDAGVKPGFIIVLLDDYIGPTGSGGTDQWTKPPIVFYGDIQTIIASNTQIDVANGAYLSGAGSYHYAQVFNGFDIGPYGYTDFLPSSSLGQGKMRYGVVNNVGSLDFEVYLNGTKTHTATGTTSTSGLNEVTLVNVAYANWTTFMSNVSVGDEIIVVSHYNERGQ